ncbi:hypothetical protein SDC9_166872 [bioreactor metagenome]|uniref:Uncharacterized protein n=1 Tax=bioreactor metagenome TaxID=1076179 RepID=A0A645FY67_9ZZZZ
MTATGNDLLKIGARVRQTISVIIFDARKFFDNDLDWITWIDESFAPANRSERCHMVDCGRLLTSLRDCEACDMSQHYRAVFGLESHKILSLCRIQRHRSLAEVPAFLSHTPQYRTMSRQDFRKAVAAWLGEQPDAASDQPLLPGFDDALDTFAGVDSHALRKAVADPETAQRSLRAGLGLFGAAISYELEQSAPDVMTLQTIRAALIAEAQKIENRLAEFGE